MRTLLYALAILTANEAFSGEITIFEVRKPIALSDKEVVQKDLYINAGSESGIQPGMIITVVRKTPLYDSFLSRSAGDLKVPVAKVKIIYAQQGLAVARFHSDIGRVDVPVLEENFILKGDALDLTTATHDKKSAANEGDSAPAKESKEITSEKIDEVVLSNL